MTVPLFRFEIRYGEEMLAGVERIRDFLNAFDNGAYDFQFSGRGDSTGVYLEFEDAVPGDEASCAWQAYQYLLPSEEGES
ncbi:MAG: hypothetical protein WAU78_01885 [Roseiarcus sp.]